MRFVISSVSNEYPLRSINELPKSSRLKIRFISDEMPTCVGIYDKKEVLIIAPVKAEFAQLPVYWSNIPCIVGLCRTYLGAYWRRNVKQRTAKLSINALLASRNPAISLN